MEQTRSYSNKVEHSDEARGRIRIPQTTLRALECNTLSEQRPLI